MWLSSWIRSSLRVCGVALLKLASYSAAARDRTTADWPVRNASADAMLMPDESVIRARARLAVRDDWLGASIHAAQRRDVVHTGIWPKANARDPDSGEPRDEYNTKADRRFRRWANNPKLCDLEGRRSLRMMEAALQQEKNGVGNSFAVVSIVRRAFYPSLVLQMSGMDGLREVRSQPTAATQSVPAPCDLVSVNHGCTGARTRSVSAGRRSELFRPPP